MPVRPIDQQNRGQILYRKGDYKGALEIFNAIIKKWPGQEIPVSVLDNRAATLIKLKRYDEALKDARRMIKHDQTVSSGYLRAGQVLRVQGKDKQTVEIYERGLELVLDPAARTVLKTELTKVRKDVVPDGAKDWMMTALPVEVLQMIIRYLEFAEMVPLLRVCKLWHAVLVGTPWFWRNLDFGLTSKKKVKHSTIQSYVERANWKVTRLVLPIAAPGTIGMVTNKCKTLEEFHSGTGIGRTDWQSTMERELWIRHLLCARRLKSLNLGSFILHFDDFFKLMRSLPSLGMLNVRVNVDSIAGSKLDVLRIPANITDLSVDLIGIAYGWRVENDLFSEAFGLESLHISTVLGDLIDVSHLENLKGFNVGLCTSALDIKLPHGIEVVSLMYRGIAEETFIYNDQGQDESYRRLRSLSVGGFHYQQRMLDLLHRCGRELEILTLWESSLLVLGYFMERVAKKHFRSLRHLVLLESKIADEQLGVIGQNCPNLKHFSIQRASEATGSGIRRLVEAVKGLESLHVVTCARVSSDISTWARKRSIKCRYVYVS